MKLHLNKNHKNNNSELFKLITKKSKKLRENLFKSFSRLISCIEILSDKKIKSFLKKKNYKNLALISFSVVVMEPNRKKFLFPVHQDLKNRLSNKSILMWIPLNKSKGSLGGVTLYKNSHKLGLLKHEIGHSGIMQLKSKSQQKIAKLQKIDFNKYNVGDVLFISPFLVHKSINNINKKDSRWTLIIQVDDLTSTKHFSKSLNPYDVDYHSASLTNEETRKKENYVNNNNNYNF